MILPTTFDHKTFIPDHSIEALLPGRVYRIIRYVPKFALKEGYILLWHSEQKIFHIHRGLRSALRACFYTTGGYGWDDPSAGQSELAQMDDFAAANIWWCYLLIDWRSLTPAQRAIYESDCLSMAGKLTNVRDEHKVDMHGWMKQAATVRDSRGRRNPNVAANRLASAAEAAGERQTDIREICEKIDPRKTVLMREIEANVSIVRRELDVARRIYSHVENGNLGGATSALLEREAVAFRKTHDRPWRHAFHKCDFDFLDAAAAIREGRRDDALRRLFWARVSLLNYTKENELGSFRLRLAMATARRPRRSEELELLFRELVAHRESVEVGGGSSAWKTKVMDRYRVGLDEAIVSWPHTRAQKGSFQKVSDCLDEAEAGL